MRAREPDAEELALARSFLGDTKSESALGPYELHSDLEDPYLQAILSSSTDGLEAVYVRRYGLDPVGVARGAIVLYAREADYRALQRSSSRLAQLTPTGHTSRGIVALYRGERTRLEVASTFVHELVHLVNRRALGPALPPWLDEGLAGDLGSSHIGLDGVIDPSRFGGQRLAWPTRIELVGPVAAIWGVGQRIEKGTQPPLREILARDWQHFVHGPAGRESYETSTLFFRFLLDPATPLHTRGGPPPGEALRAFLASVAQGRDPSADALRTRLGVPWSELEAAFRSWVVDRSAELKAGD